jgi:hypothetical protein
MQNLSELTRRLIASQVEFVLVGGFAAAAHGVTLITRDVDICCRFSEPNLMRIHKAFADLHPVHRPRTDLPLELTPQQCASLKNLYLKTDLGAVDCLGEVLGIGNFDEVLKNSVELRLPCGSCRIISIDALIRAKEAMNRNHDWITVHHLKEIKKQQSQN